MQQIPDWRGLPYYPISQYYQERFGHRVRKISISTGQSCPNRDGINGMKTCNFCDEWGSAAHPEFNSLALREQISEVREVMRRSYNANKFLVYFQAYTTTFTRSEELRRQIEVALSFQDVVGVVLGTRPDCLSDAVMELLAKLSKQIYVSVELGVQSFSDQQLLWMRRGHDAECSRTAIRRLQEKTNVDLGIHLMFGWPGESDEDAVKAAIECNKLKVNHIKLHNLHVLRNTPLAEDFEKHAFKPIEKAAYFQRSRLFLQNLNPNIAVHRLAALSNRPEELISPEWTGYKMRTYQEFLDYMGEMTAWQGQDFGL